MNELIRELVAGGPVLTDGAWGTQLQQRGLPVGACPDAWNLENADAVEAVARSYVEAGSRVILTNTFGASRLQLQRHNLADRTVEINRAGAAISRRAAAGRALVFASVGPSGKMLMMEECTREELHASFLEQAHALREGGADAIVVETMTDLDEAAIAVAAAKASGLPVVGCMVYDSGPDKCRTMMGTTPEEAAAGLVAAGADVVGANCGQGIEGFLPICQRLRAAVACPIWIKANAGLPEMREGKAIYAVTPEHFAAQVPALIAAGASFIGGCCGTAPAFIAAVRDVLARRAV